MVHPAPLSVTARGLTDVGRRRDHNEDALLVDDDLHLYVVADGMGGHAGGGTASRLAVDTIQRTLRAARARAPDAFAPELPESSPLPGVLRGAVEQACAVIHAAAQADPELAGMGTTVTAVLLDGRSAFVAHVGDSRCYLLRGARIQQVTEDHSLVNEQVKAGALTAAEAKHSRFKNIITRSVGFEREVLVDLAAFALAPGDAIVVCCDGLTNLVEDDEILRVVTEAPLEDAPPRLVALANARGGDDNITVIAVRVGPDEAP
ncbi:Stp1/IreP family PP2C-type Ser/Thr phosphatase [Anaeromyxobacter sp. Fw109-5]|uniref:Stp1/IreP family PP2C-type Ser/Thr phosphatase n=1 Tax=Anaeromyxobacter sp. (strain Fw109-5) TaxID=404589 RepID=UPI00031FD543|nr:Stp1/IreP family PP2C-type Ser/Thr phosphatase [Anaeromyxobacter sp. Fw109-5]